MLVKLVESQAARLAQEGREEELIAGGCRLVQER